MCSSRCETPVTPAVSFRDPTLYQTMNETTGAVCTSWISTWSPFSRVVSETGDRACGGAAGVMLAFLFPLGADEVSASAVAGRRVEVRIATVTRPASGAARRDRARRIRVLSGIGAPSHVGSYRSNAATHSMCGVWGNMSTGRTQVSRYRDSQRSARSRPRVLGLQETYTRRRAPR